MRMVSELEINELRIKISFLKINPLFCSLTAYERIYFLNPSKNVIHFSNINFITSSASKVS